MRRERKCKVADCGSRHKARGFCERHYAQYRNGIIDEDGQELRPLRYDSSGDCMVEGCDGQPVGRGFCMRHYVQFRRGCLDEDGKRLRRVRTYNSNRTCKMKTCRRKHYGRGFCNKHYERYKVGIIDTDGNQIRSFKGEPDRKCSVEDCEREHHARGMCMKHYHRWLRRRKKVAEKATLLTPAAAQALFQENKATLADADRFNLPSDTATPQGGDRPSQPSAAQEEPALTSSRE